LKVQIRSQIELLDRRPQTKAWEPGRPPESVEGDQVMRLRRYLAVFDRGRPDHPAKFAGDEGTARDITQNETGKCT
jgi:hypothetical protein